MAVPRVSCPSFNVCRTLPSALCHVCRGGIISPPFFARCISVRVRFQFQTYKTMHSEGPLCTNDTLPRYNPRRTLREQIVAWGVLVQDSTGRKSLLRCCPRVVEQSHTCSSPCSLGWHLQEAAEDTLVWSGILDEISRCFNYILEIVFYLTEWTF